MPLVSRDRFARATRAVDAGTLAAFVADLYRARGYEVDRPADGRLRLEPEGRVLAVRPGGARDVPAEADAVVIPAGDRTAGVDVVDADTLYRQLHYAVDRPVARALLATHLGVDPAREATDEDAVPLGGHPLTGSGLALGLALVAAVALAGALVVAGVAELPGDAGESPAGTPSQTPTGTTTTPATPDAGAMDASAAPGLQSVDDSNDESFPPGVDGEGVSDADELVSAHRARLTDRSFTLRVWHREFVDGRLAGVYVETVRVENASHYRVSVSQTGTLRTTPQTIVGANLYVAGERRYLTGTVVGSYFRSRATPARFRRQVGQYLRWSLTVEESSVAGRATGADRTVHRLRTAGDAYSLVDDAAGTAYVTGEGLVTYGRWTYRPPDKEDVRVEFAVQTTDVGTTTVRRPGWVDDE
jgi:hypothetical protein